MGLSGPDLYRIQDDLSLEAQAIDAHPLLRPCGTPTALGPCPTALHSNFVLTRHPCRPAQPAVASKWPKKRATRRSSEALQRGVGALNSLVPLLEASPVQDGATPEVLSVKLEPRGHGEWPGRPQGKRSTHGFGTSHLLSCLKRLKGRPYSRYTIDPKYTDRWRKAISIAPSQLGNTSSIPSPTSPEFKIDQGQS